MFLPYDILLFFGPLSSPLTFPNVKNHEKGSAEGGSREIAGGRRATYFVLTSPAAIFRVQVLGLGFRV